jgi:hypothetical protein
MTNSQKPNWLVSHTLSSEGEQRRYVVHVATPRFVARVAKVYHDLTIDEEEGHIDLASRDVSFFQARENIFGLCEVDWSDAVPGDARKQWIERAVEAFCDYENEADGFRWWKTLEPVREMALRVGLDISRCREWSDYTEAFCNQNDRTNGALIDRVRSVFDNLSSGELPVLLAMLHAADYSRVADELVGSVNWRRLDQTYGEHAKATALPIIRA